TPSIDQYVETVPSSSGGWSAATSLPRSKPLRPAVAKHLRQRSDHVTKLLQTAATSSTYGAPQHRLATPTTKKNRQTTKPSNESNPFGAAVGAVSSSGDSHIYWLLAAIV